MPTRSNDTSAFTARQVLHRAITAIENLNLLIQEAETLAYCASLSLDALPANHRWSSRNPSAGSAGSFRVGGPGAPYVGAARSAYAPDSVVGTGGGGPRPGSATGTGSGLSGSVEAASFGSGSASGSDPGANASVEVFGPGASAEATGSRSSASNAAFPGRDSTSATTADGTPADHISSPDHSERGRPGAFVQGDDFDLDALDEIIDSVADLDSGDLTSPGDPSSGDNFGAHGAGGDGGDGGDGGILGIPDAYDAQDRSLATGRLYTLVIAESKASRRTLLYCQRVRRALSAALARLPRPEPRPARGSAGSSDSGSFQQSWLGADSES